MNRYYAVFLVVKGRKCVVVGGGQVAARKAKSLADAGARVKVVSPVFCQRLSRLASRRDVVLDRKRFRARDLDGAFLAIACTDDRKVNENVHAAAKRRGIIANVVDSAQLCDFIVPSLLSRGPLTIAVSTSGVSPALARRIRQQLGKRYGRRYTDFLELMEKSRDRIMKEVPTASHRKSIFEALTAEDFIDEFVTKDAHARKKLFEEKLNDMLSSAEGDHV